MSGKRLCLFLVVALPLIGEAKTVLGSLGNEALDAQMERHTRLFYGLHAYPFGVGLTIARLKDAGMLQSIRDWLWNGKGKSLMEFTGLHPYEIVAEYEGPAGIGLRGGGAVIGTAFRYMALKQENAPPDVLDSARQEVVKALKNIWVIHVITGIPHGIARGAMLLKPLNQGEPPFPHPQVNIVPLFDENGEPLPKEKNNGCDRADNSHGLLPEGLWYWQDSCSKDQLVGWVAAMATLYDASKDDPTVDQALVSQLEQVACNVGAGLREKQKFQAVDGNTYEYDLVIMDADGRPTLHHDLNPYSLDGTYFPPDSPFFNVFNAVMAMGILKGLYHVCGDEELRAFLYDELIGRRGYLDRIEASDATDYIYMGAKTNFSNVNMIAIALFLNIYFEGDEVIASRMRRFMENRWWDVKGVLQSAKNLKQPYFYALYEAMTDKGSSDERTNEVARLLLSFTLDPYTDEQRINCDDEEIANKKCIAIDGKTVITLQDVTNRGDKPIATEALDPSIRPPSNFDARSDPFEVNGGGGGTGLNPGGDLHTAYWLLRYLPFKLHGESSKSPFARGTNPVQAEDAALPDNAGVEVFETYDVANSSEADDQQRVPAGNGSSCMASAHQSACSVQFLIFCLLLFGVSRRLSGWRKRKGLW